MSPNVGQKSLDADLSEVELARDEALIVALGKPPACIPKVGANNGSRAFLPASLIRRYPVFSRVSIHYRRKRIEKFIEMMAVDGDTTILDVGGMPYYWRDFPLKPRVTCLNLYKAVDPLPENVKVVLYDGQKFPFTEQSFDIVHSNSVIEHVGDYHAQKTFAAEIMRVGKRYWVQTPNFFLPFEPHAQFPCFQFFPPNLKLLIGKRWKKAGYPYEELLAIQLLTKAQLRDLFPSCSIWAEKIMFFPKCYCAYGAAESRGVLES